MAERLSLLAGTFDILTGRDANHLFEHVGEMALITKTCLNGRFQDGGALKQPAFRLTDPNLLLVDMWRDSCTAGEHAEKMIRAEMSAASQISQ